MWGILFFRFQKKTLSRCRYCILEIFDFWFFFFFLCFFRSPVNCKIATKFAIWLFDVLYKYISASHFYHFDITILLLKHTHTHSCLLNLLEVSHLFLYFFDFLFWHLYTCSIFYKKRTSFMCWFKKGIG